LQGLVDISRFSPCVINLSRNKNICCRLKKVVAKRRARLYFEQQILALLLDFHQTHNLSRNKFARALEQINQSERCISSTNIFVADQVDVQGVKRETSTKTCNETILRDKLRFFVSRISPP